jgi:NAD-dependent deacetylase
MLVIGTSAVVQPAASLPSVAKEHGAAVVEVNIEQAFPGADACILEKAGTALPQILAELKTRL